MSKAELDERRRIAEIARQLQADFATDADRNGSLSGEKSTRPPPLIPGASRFSTRTPTASCRGGA